MKHARLSLFALTLCSLVLGVFVVPESAQAVVCTYAPQNPGEPDGCQVFPTLQQCRNFCNALGRPCAPNDSLPTCEGYLEGQEQNRRLEAEQAENQRRIEEGRARIKANEERDAALQKELSEGSCVCQRINEARNDAAAPGENTFLGIKTTIPNIGRDECVDGVKPDKLDAADTGEYTNCEWVENSFIDSDINKNVNSEIEKENAIPFNTIKSQARSLNKLKANSVQNLIGDIIRIAMGVMGSIALIMCIYGGFLWMTATGNASRVEKAQDVLIWGALGIFIILGSYALIEFVFEAASTTLTY